MLMGFTGFVLLSLSTLGSAHEAAYTFKKQILIWDKTAETTVPLALAPPWQIEETLSYPDQLGTFTSIQKVFELSPFQITIQFFWIRPSDETQTDYWVTQSKIEVKDIGIIAECSRFNEPKPTYSVGIGACSGRFESHQIGVTIQ